MVVTRGTRLRFAMAVAGAACVGCAPGVAPAAAVPAVSLVGAGGASIDAKALSAAAAFTVFVFYSPDCHCFAQHEDRLRALDAELRPRGVQVLLVDSEVRASADRDADEARRRSYPFPVLVDRGAKLADALGADYATYSVVVDRGGQVRYRGGIDSDKNHLHDDAVPYLRDALSDLLAGRHPRVASSKTLGCALQKW